MKAKVQEEINKIRSLMERITPSSKANTLDAITQEVLAFFKSLTEEQLNAIAVDLRFIPKPSAMPSYSTEKVMVEALGDSIEPDEAISTMLKTYLVPEYSILKRELYHHVYIYMLTAQIGENLDIVTEEMNNMGYFVSKKIKTFTFNGIEYITLQFEPSCQISVDQTDKIKEAYDCLYHWTPQYCLENVVKQGLIPSSRNSVFQYPPRIYFMEGNGTAEQQRDLGYLLFKTNKDERNDGRYALLRINHKELDDSIRFFGDPLSEIGVFTEQPIPPTAITLLTVIQFPKL